MTLQRPNEKINCPLITPLHDACVYEYFNKKVLLRDHERRTGRGSANETLVLSGGGGDYSWSTVLEGVPSWSPVHLSGGYPGHLSMGRHPWSPVRDSP